MGGLLAWVLFDSSIVARHPTRATIGSVFDICNRKELTWPPKPQRSRRYLKEIRGQQQISYKDTPNEPIHVHNNQRFITNSLEPTPVS